MALTIELPSLEGQTPFNTKRWREILADSSLKGLPHRIETDRHGHIVMSPPPAFSHGKRQAKIAGLLLKLMPEGEAVTECPLSTSDGVKAIDVAWLSPRREENTSEPIVLEHAPDICVEIISPSNTASEIQEKRALYFEAGAQEVWTCSIDGNLIFYVALEQQVDASVLCQFSSNRHLTSHPAIRSENPPNARTTGFAQGANSSACWRSRICAAVDRLEPETRENLLIILNGHPDARPLFTNTVTDLVL